MSRSITLLLALGAVLLALGAWWITSLGDGAAPVESTAVAREDPRPVDPRPEEPELSIAQPATSSPVAPQEPSGRTRIVSNEEEGSLSGAVVDTLARPIPGARIAAIRLGAIEFDPAADTGPPEEERSVARTTTGDDGQFEMHLALGRAHCLTVTAEGYAPTLAPRVHAGDFLTIVVRRGASVSGRVTRREDDVPIAGARVVITRAEVSPPIWEGTTDENGKYSAQGLDPGPDSLTVIPVEECRERISLDLEEGATLVRDVQVSFGLIVTGEVKSKETGLPIAGAQVGSELDLGKVVGTDAAGRYELPGLAEAPVVNLSARAEGYGGYELSLQTASDRILTANFELTRGRVASGRVVLRDGQPVPGALVAALSRSVDRGGLRTDRVSARTRGDGRFQLAGLRSDLPHALLVRREGFAPGVIRGFDAHPGGELKLGDIVLAPGASLSGRVASPDGKPILDARIDLTTSDPAYSDPSLGLGHRSLRTGSEGRFHFLDLPPGPHVLRVSVPGLEAEEKVDLDLAEGEIRRDVEIVVGSGRMLRGRVLDPEGIGLEAADLVLRRSADGAALAATTSGPDGRFQFAGLGAGVYDLHATFADLHGPSTDRYEMADVTLSGLTAGTTEVEVAFRRIAGIDGRVVTPDGTAVPFALVVAVDKRGLRLDGRAADEEGRFRLRVPSDSTVELRAWRTTANPETGRGRWADESSIPEAMQSEVRAGEREITLVIAP